MKKGESYKIEVTKIEDRFLMFQRFDSRENARDFKEEIKNCRIKDVLEPKEISEDESSESSDRIKTIRVKKASG